MVGILGHQHLREQGRSRDTFVYHRCGHRRLHQRAACRTRPLATHVPLHGEHAGGVVQLLADVLAYALEGAAASARGVLRFMSHLAPWQPLRQGRALGLLLFVIRLGRQRGLQRGQLFVDRGDVTVHGLVKRPCAR